MSNSTPKPLIRRSKYSSTKSGSVILCCRILVFTTPISRGWHPNLTSDEVAEVTYHDVKKKVQLIGHFAVRCTEKTFFGLHDKRVRHGCSRLFLEKGTFGQTVAEAREPLVPGKALWTYMKTLISLRNKSNASLNGLVGWFICDREDLQRQHLMYHAVNNVAAICLQQGLTVDHVLELPPLLYLTVVNI